MSETDEKILHEAKEIISQGIEMKQLLSAPWYKKFFKGRMESLFEEFKRANPSDPEQLARLCGEAKVLQDFQDELQGAAMLSDQVADRLREMEAQSPDQGGKDQDA